jgi:hypothetical protein
MTPRPRPVTVTFTTEDGRSASRTLQRFQSDSTGQARVPAILGPGAYSIVVESEDPLAAERITTWPAAGIARGAHASSGVAAPATHWVFAEGTTRAGAQDFLLLANPGALDATVDVQYLCAGLAPTARRHQVSARGRTTIWVNHEGPPLDAAECGAQLTSDRPIVAERSLYLSGAGGFGAGTAASGMSPGDVQPSAAYFAAGATQAPFDMFLTLINPVPGADLTVDVTYLLADGAEVLRSHAVPGLGRTTVWVDYEDPALADAPSVAVRIEGRTGFVFAERALWWSQAGVSGWIEGHVEVGARGGRERWALAHVPESATIAILNTAGVAGQVKITLFSKNGIGAAERVLPVLPGQTTVRPTELWPALGPDRYSATVESLPLDGAPAVPIVVERVSYAPGRALGTAFLATPLP